MHNYALHKLKYNRYLNDLQLLWINYKYELFDLIDKSILKIRLIKIFGGRNTISLHSGIMVGYLKCNNNLV